MADRFKILYKGGESELVVKKSRFIATLSPVESEEEAAAFLAEMRKKYWDASHNCFAFTIGMNHELTRCSDDGEPSGTAGKPILEVIRGQGLHNVLIVVTRYFGGTLLGTGGLVRAYTAASLEGLVELLPVTEQRQKPAGNKEKHYRYDVSYRGIDWDKFPFGIWRKLNREILVNENKDLFATGDPKGEEEFRRAISSYLHAARGVNCLSEQILVGAGSEYLLMLLSRILGSDKCVAMENPTYRQAFKVLCSLGHPVVPVEMDKSGLSVDRLEKSGADIAYVMPSHQYPTGIVMPIKRRMELLAWAAAREGRYVIEDDYDSEFRYRGKPIPCLQGSDPSDHVIYIGTFSRSIAPAIRISYMVLPKNRSEERRVGKECRSRWSRYH